MNRESHLDDLDWTAFRYIADELSAEEVEAFEIVLADRQDARDAVARAVQLTGAMAAAIPQSEYATVKPGNKRPGNSKTRRWLIGATAASCLILLSVLAIRGWLPAPDRQTTVVDSPSANDVATDSNSSWAGNLVSLWASADSTTSAPNSADVEGDIDLSEWQLAQNDQSRDLIVPDWLVIAVSNESDGLSNPGSAEEINSL